MNKDNNRNQAYDEIDQFLAQFDDDALNQDSSQANAPDTEEPAGGRKKRSDSKKKAKSKSGSKSKSKPKKKRSFKSLFYKGSRFSVLKLIRNLIVLMLVCFIGAGAYAVSVIAMADKIDPNNIYDNIAQNSVVYDDEGNEIDEVFYSQNRSIIKYDEMSPDLINAFVAIEDKTFWKHHGFNWIRMFGAIFEKLTGHGSISGTSTITQQLARNVYLPETKSERSIKRKLIEMYYAYRIEKTLSKEEIIEAYLNSVYFGFGAYGVDAAADSYFSKSAKDLTLVESAALAALPQLPDTYALVKYAGSGVSEGDKNIIMREPDTYVANDISADRRDLCLDLMLEQGYITKEQHDEAYERSVMEFINPHITAGSSNYTYFTDYLLDEVENDLIEEYGMTPEEAERMIYTGGLNIYSTLDTTAQDAIVKEFNDPDNFPYLSGIRYDDEDNITASDGSVMLYDYDNFFNEDGEFVFGEDEAVVNSDGSITVKRGNKLSIYTTEVAGNVDYSLEFKNTYVMDEDSTLYIYQGGYINVPAGYKSLDENDDLVISADYMTDYPDNIVIDGGTVKLEPSVYSLPQKQIQPQSACVIVQVGTGQVKAMVGGRGATGRQLYNRALNPRQPGSSIKPLSVYGSALQKSYEYASAGQKFPFVDYGHDKQGAKYYGDYLTAASCVIDEKMTFDGRTWPYNVDNSFSGPTTMRQGMRNSLNTVAVKIELQLGDQYSADMLKKFGLTTIETEDPDVNDLNPAALALGGLTHGAIPLEMAQAYATYPNGGVRRTSIAYTTVTDRNGNVILTAKSDEIKVVDEGVAWIMTDMLKYVVSSGYASAASLSGVQSGGKSGTTNSNYDIWFDGITPNYACVVWIGTDVNIPLSSMSIMSVRLWGRIMDQIPKAKIGEYRSMPDNVVKVKGEYFTKGTEKGLSTYIEDEKKKKEDEENKAAAQVVVEMIASASADDPASVEAARAAYVALTAEQKKFVTNAEQLSQLEAKVAEKKAAEEAARQEEERKRQEEEERKRQEEEAQQQQPDQPDPGTDPSGGENGGGAGEGGQGSEQGGQENTGDGSENGGNNP